MNESKRIVCIGEVLWDALPGGLFLGGAPLNVCLHLHRLGSEADMVSRVGDDRLGREALRRITMQGLGTEYIQIDEVRETGFVKVDLEAVADPGYQIIQPAAWDYIELERPEIARLLESAWAVVFGSLARRMNPQMNAIRDLDCLKVFDMNLRSPHYDRDNVVALVRHADIVKMNDKELVQLCEWCSIDGEMEETVRQLSEHFGCSTICVTKGGRGAVLFHGGQWFEHPGYEVRVADAVGAGDAFLAALLHGLSSGSGADNLLPFSNAAGAFVAMQPGANPRYSKSRIESIVREGVLVE